MPSKTDKCLEKGSKTFLILFLTSLRYNFIDARRLEITISSFDTRLYENALNTEECERQLSYIRKDLNLKFQFLDAGLHFPKFLSQGNTLDMGNYHGCLGIHQAADDGTIQGKYCMIDVPSNQEINLPNISELTGFSKISEDSFQNDILSEEVIQLNKSIQNTQSVRMSNKPRSLIENAISPIEFRMAICIPKPCTVSEGLKGLFDSTMAEGFQYEEEFCRLPNDKPWAPADYVAIVLFSAIGIITVISTLYDLRNQLILQRDPKSANPIYTSFSVYTNARRLTTISKNFNNLDCVDGVRALSMAWVIILHNFPSPPYIAVLNITEYRNWELALRSIWITSGSIAVDTFLMMSGMLLVYSKVGKLTGSKLIRNLHLFYLNRILRMFPLLGAAILMQASFFHWISDGPLWQKMADATDSCRNYWWLNLLYVNNFFIPMCINASWYVSVDVQLHIVSPVLLYFVLSGSKRQAWGALAGGLLAVQTAATIYVFVKQLPVSMVHSRRTGKIYEYWTYYYLNTLPRAAPFFVGMMFGYILHLNRQQKPQFSKITVLLLWCFIIVTCLLSLYSSEPMKDVNFDNQAVESLVNAFAKSAWALAVASLVLVCVNGYGGPVNWFLSLRFWKLISRISYAMYLFHTPLLTLIIGSCVQPIYFTVSGFLYSFLSVFSVTFIVGFIATLVIDSPFSIIFNQLLGEGMKKSQKEIPQNSNIDSHDVQKLKNIT